MAIPQRAIGWIQCTSSCTLDNWKNRFISEWQVEGRRRSSHRLVKELERWQSWRVNPIYILREGHMPAVRRAAERISRQQNLECRCRTWIEYIHHSACRSVSLVTKTHEVEPASEQGYETLTDMCICTFKEKLHLNSRKVPHGWEFRVVDTLPTNPWSNSPFDWYAVSLI